MRVLWTITALFVVGHVVANLTDTAEDALDVGREGDLPTLFAGALFVFNAVLMALIGRTSQRRGLGNAPYWYVVALVFAVLGVDEVFDIHQRLMGPLSSAYDSSVVPRFAWLVPTVVAGLLLIGLFSRFLLRLPRETVRGLLGAALVYVFGAVAIQYVTVVINTSDNLDLGPVFQFLRMTEEVVELAGLILVVAVLLTYIEEHLGGIEVGGTPSTETGSAAEGTDRAD